MTKQILFILFFTVGSFSLFGQDTSRELQNRQRDMLLQIEETSKQLDEANKNVSASLQQLALLNQKVVLRKQYIAGVNNEIADIEDEIYMVQEDIKDQVDDLNKEKERYALVLRGMQKNSYYKNKLLFILSAKSLTQSYRRFEYLKEIYVWQKKQLERIKRSQDELLSKEKNLEAKRSEKLSLLSVQQAEDMKLFEEEKKQQAIVDDLKQRQGVLQAELSKQKEQALELNRLIEGVITVDAESSAKNQEGEDRASGENKGDYAMTSSEQSLSSKFENNKGRLPYPVSGKYLITGKYGEQQYEELKQNTITNSGINIQALTNNDVKAVFEGDVSAVFALSGYHNSVIIRHGDYLTVYANLSSVFVKKGDKVSAGQTIGKIYTDRDAGNISTLYFQIRKGKTKLNPEVWLK